MKFQVCTVKCNPFHVLEKEAPFPFVPRPKIALTTNVKNAKTPNPDVWRAYEA